jgi:hypothetical protein
MVRESLSERIGRRVTWLVFTILCLCDRQIFSL